MINKQWQTGKRVIKGLIGVVLAVTCVTALAACSGSEDEGKLEGVTVSGIEGNWVASNYTFGINQYQYTVDMPPYVENEADGISQFQCNTFGEDYNVYGILVTPQIYNSSFTIPNENIDVNINDFNDALDKTNWFLRTYLAKFIAPGKTLTYEFTDKTVIENFGDQVYSCNCKITGGDEPINMKLYWLHITDRYGYIFISDNSDMLDKIVASVTIAE